MSLTICPPDVAGLAGLWTRSLLRTDEGDDRATMVAWAQGPSLFVDLRQPPDRPDFSHATHLEELTAQYCAWLARQQGFAGLFREENGVFWWQREIDFQPPAAMPDAGALFWEGETLVETGHFCAYLEHWHRTPNHPPLPCGALRLRREADGRAAIFVRAGECFMFARGRAPGVVPHGASLSEAVAKATTVSAAQALLDCEISLGITMDWQITHSTLPFREGVIFDLAGWEIMFAEGEYGL